MPDQDDLRLVSAPGSGDDVRLAEVEVFLRTLLANAPMGVTVYRPEGSCVLANQAAADCIGATFEQVRGQDFRKIGSWRESGMLDLADRALATGEPQQLDVHVVSTFGREVFLDFRLQVLDIADQRLLLAMFVDVTPEKLAERDLREHSNAALRRSEQALQTTVDALRMANRDLEQFAYAAAHDLREPLRNLVTHSQLLKRSLGDRLEARDAEVMERIAYAAGRMDDLVRGMLDYGQIGASFVETDEVALEAVVRDLRDALSWRLEDAGAELTTDELPRVVGNRRRLSQVLNNLVINALKFHGPEPPRIHLSSRRRNGEWVICVTDNGVGIHPDHHERIFDMFERLHDGSEIPGVGIGLAVCKKIVELHGGQIWVESRGHDGSRFCFTLPAA